MSAKKNERIGADLERQKTELAKVKSELEKLQTTPVSTDTHSCKPYQHLSRPPSTSFYPTTNSSNGIARSFKSAYVVGKGERRRSSVTSQISRLTLRNRVSESTIGSRRMKTDTVRLVSIQPRTAESRARAALRGCQRAEYITRRSHSYEHRARTTLSEFR